jgi:hypothetical protein
VLTHMFVEDVGECVRELTQLAIASLPRISP